MFIFLALMPCNIWGIKQCFGGTCCLYLQCRSEDGGSRFLRNVG